MTDKPIPQWCKAAAKEVFTASHTGAMELEERHAKLAAIIAKHAPAPAPAVPFNGHTELPWNAFTDDSGSGHTNITSGALLRDIKIVLSLPRRDKNEPDIRFILHAVNTYYQREQALTACVEALEKALLPERLGKDYDEAVDAAYSSGAMKTLKREKCRISDWYFKSAYQAVKSALARAREVRG